MTIDWQPFRQVVEEHTSFLLTTHIRSDCDAVGSEMGLAGVLHALGKQVAIVNGDAPPEHISFMDPDCRIGVVGLTAPLEALRGFEVLVVVDTSSWAQLGRMAEVVRSFRGTRVVIDHHVSEDDFGAMVFKDPTAEATGRLIMQAAKALGVQLTPDIASPLFTAIATDTGWFRFSSVTADTFAALAKLTAAGAEPARIFAQLYEQHTLPRLLLRGRILNHIAPDCNDRLLWSYASAADFRECDAQQTDTEDAINALLTVAGVEAAALFVELEPAVTKISLRSRSDFDVRKVAEKFGGGGHRAAAGITYNGPREAAQAAVLDALRAGMGCAT